MQTIFPSKNIFYSHFILCFILALSILTPQANARERDYSKQTETHNRDLIPLKEVVTGIGGVAALAPANLECGLSMVHGIGGILSPTPNYPMEYPVIGTLVVARTPSHILRLTQFCDILRDCASDLKLRDPDSQHALAAKYLHAFMNHVLPIAYMTYMTYTPDAQFSPFVYITLPPLMLSYFVRGLEVSQNYIPHELDPYTYPLAVGGAIVKGLIVQKIVKDTFVLDTLRTPQVVSSLGTIACSALSWGSFMASAGLTFKFDKHKIAHYIQLLRDNPTGIYGASLQAGLITTAYYGFTKAILSDVPLSFIPYSGAIWAGSYLMLETATEAVSLYQNFHTVKRKFLNWRSSRSST